MNEIGCNCEDIEDIYDTDENGALCEFGECRSCGQLYGGRTVNLNS